MRDGCPSWLLAQIGGFPQAARFSTLLHAPLVSATATNIARLQRVADAIHFPREEIFEDEAAR